MKRREFVGGSAAIGLVAMLAACKEQKVPPSSVSANGPQASSGTSYVGTSRLTPPAHGIIPVAFAVSDGTVMIDLAGPWEVFTDVMIPSRGTSIDDQMPFRPDTVAESKKSLHKPAPAHLE